MFFSRKEYSSLKNGTIIVSTFLFESPSVLVDTCLQSGPYILSMWKDSFKKLPSNFSPKRILLLGLGGGNVVKLLRKKYTEAHITVIEWDEVMIDIAKNIEPSCNDGMVTIICDDAFSVIANDETLFDLIIVDLFSGENPPSLLASEQVQCSLKKLLMNNGYMLVNLYRHEKYSSSFGTFFALVERWQFRTSSLLLFRSS